MPPKQRQNSWIVMLCGPLAFVAAGAVAADAGDGASLASFLNEPTLAEPRPIAPEPHPFTIEPGRFSIEYSPLHYTRDREPGVRVDTWSMPVTFKAGVLEHLDLHIGFDPILREREVDRIRSTRTISRGFGEVTLRTKYNLWGNDELVHDTALSVMPFIHVPTGRVHGHRSVEGGLLVPFAWFPWEGLDIEWTPGFAAVRGIDTHRHVFEFSSALVFNQEVLDGVIGFFEFGSAVTSESGQSWAGVLGVGVTLEPSDDFVIEPAVHFGVTSGADDLVVSLTLVMRF